MSPLSVKSTSAAAFSRSVPLPPSNVRLPSATGSRKLATVVVSVSLPVAGMQTGVVVRIVLVDQRVAVVIVALGRRVKSPHDMPRPANRADRAEIVRALPRMSRGAVAHDRS